MSNVHLTEQKCEACEGGVPPLTREEVDELLVEVPGWRVNADTTVLSREYDCGDFARALQFINQVGEIAEAEGHHPNLHLTDYKYVHVDLTTHAISGLSKNDFIVAAKINTLDE